MYQIVSHCIDLSIIADSPQMSLEPNCNLLLSIVRFPEGDPAILKGQGGEVSMEISTRDIIKMRDK